LLVEREAAQPAGTDVRADADLTQRKHVRVRPRPGPLVRRPPCRALELLAELGPRVPEVVRDPPHLGVGPQRLEVRQGQLLAGRQAQRDGAAGLVDRGGDRGDLPLLDGRVEDVVELDEVHAPLGQCGDERVVVRLRRWVGHVDAVVVGVPRADAGPIGDLPAGGRRAEHRQVPFDGATGHATHQVHAEPQAQLVDPGREAAERPVRR